MKRIALVLCAGLLACGGDDDGALDASTDARADASELAPCALGFVCDDGAFCNGPEVCAPDDPSADPNGCVSEGAPCAIGGLDCDEDRDECVSCERGGPDDRDGDGFCATGSDCDDGDPEINPDAVELCLGQADRTAVIDEDCNRATLGPDRDGDGFAPTYCCNGGAGNCGLDCDDDRDGINPSAVDGCGGGDEDCDTRIDEEPGTPFYRDEDGDGYGVATDVVRACGLPDGYAAVAGDCDDSAPLINPGETEICDGLDNNCEAGIDEVADGAPACVCFEPGATRDCGDYPIAQWNVGQCRSGSQVCGADGQWGPCVGVVPPGLEFCGGGDEDCDGLFDESRAESARVWYRDQDGDGVGTSETTLRSCLAPDGWVPLSGDCDDDDPLSFPGRVESCSDPADNNCNSRSDAEDCTCTAGETQTGCGSPTDVGECAYGRQDCVAASGTWGACVGAIGPREETCNERDDDCDGRVDDGFDCSGSEIERERRACPGLLVSVDQERTCSECAWGAWRPRFDDSTCDGWYDDCDTNVDEHYVTRPGARCRRAIYRHARNLGAPPFHRPDIFYHPGTDPSGANHDGTGCETDAEAGSECYLFSLMSSQPSTSTPSTEFQICRRGDWDSISAGDCPSGWTMTTPGTSVGWGFPPDYYIAWLLIGEGDIVPVMGLADIGGNNVFLTTDPAKIDAARASGAYLDLDRVSPTNQLPMECRYAVGTEDPVCILGFTYRDFF